MSASATKRVKQSQRKASTEKPADLAVPSSSAEGSMRDMLELRQLLMKATVQQLNLLPKANALTEAAKGGRTRDARAAAQFNLLLSIQESLSLQANLSAKGSVPIPGVSDLQTVVAQTLLTAAHFQTRASDKTRMTHELSLEALEDNLVGFCDEVLLETQPVIDKWNHSMMKGISANLGGISKSPVELAREIHEDSEKIRALHRPVLVEGCLGKRASLGPEDVANLYEDTPMTHQILKDLLHLNRAFQAELTEGIQFGNTERYLRDRASRKSAKRDKVPYDERKDRKIRFDVHEKLVDFMPVETHTGLLPNRDTVLANLFGRAGHAGLPEDTFAPAVADSNFFQDIDLL